MDRHAIPELPANGLEISRLLTENTLLREQLADAQSELASRCDRIAELEMTVHHLREHSAAVSDCLKEIDKQKFLDRLERSTKIADAQPKWTRGNAENKRQASAEEKP